MPAVPRISEVFHCQHLQEHEPRLSAPSYAAVGPPTPVNSVLMMCLRFRNPYSNVCLVDSHNASTTLIQFSLQAKARDQPMHNNMNCFKYHLLVARVAASLFAVFPKLLVVVGTQSNLRSRINERQVMFAVRRKKFLIGTVPR